MHSYRISLLALVLVLPANLSAHPHSWINLKSEFILDAQGRLVGLYQHWEFDVYYSMMTFADTMNEHGDKEEGLNKLADDMVRNLRGHNYFTELKLGSRQVGLKPPFNYQLSTVMRDEQEILKLSMQFRISEAGNLENQMLSLRVFDPTYYIDMRHHETSQVIIHTTNGLECTTTVELPEVSDELAEYAASLDKSQKNTLGLGDQFAEQVLVRCI